MSLYLSFIFSAEEVSRSNANRAEQLGSHGCKLSIYDLLDGDQFKILLVTNGMFDGNQFKTLLVTNNLLYVHNTPGGKGEGLL